MRCVASSGPPAGEIRFLGQHIARLPPHRIMRRGIVQVPEGRLIFGGLTIAQNLRLGAYNVPGRARAEADIDRVLEFFPMLRDQARRARLGAERRAGPDAGAGPRADGPAEAV